VFLELRFDPVATWVVGHTLAALAAVTRVADHNILAAQVAET